MRAWMRTNKLEKGMKNGGVQGEFRECRRYATWQVPRTRFDFCSRIADSPEFAGRWVWVEHGERAALVVSPPQDRE